MRPRRTGSGGVSTPIQGDTMATGETGFDDVTFDLVSVQYHSLKAGHDYGQYVRDAENAGLDDIAQFFRKVMKEDSERAGRCHELLKQVSGTDQAGPAVHRSGWQLECVNPVAWHLAISSGPVPRRENPGWCRSRWVGLLPRPGQGLCRCAGGGTVGRRGSGPSPALLDFPKGLG